jgi:RNA polymerase sigma-70 factor (ECF subfamily)
MRQAFEKAVNALPPNLREVFLFRHDAGLSYAEIATAFGIPIGTVSKWLYEARQRLMEDLRDFL